MEFFRFLFLVPLLLLVDNGSAVRVPGPSKQAVNDQTQSASFWSQSESSGDVPAPGYYQSSHEIVQTHPDRQWSGNGNGDGNTYRYKDLRKNVDAELLRNPSLSSPEECARACREGEPPKICYYHFTLELYTVLGAACQVCAPNATNQIQTNCQCVLADGVESSILTVNRMIPGPSLQLCKGDKAVIDVENKMEGMESTIHWHGIFQKGSQYYDGVPFVTQCPIHQGNTFRYQYVVGNAGTHFWHAHTGLQKMDGIHGSLIVREPPSEDPNSHLYDFDLTTHVCHISDWMHGLGEERFPGKLAVNTGQDPDNFLINGRGRYRDPNTGLTTNTPLEVFTVTPGKRYRFRCIFSTATVCPSQLTVQGHDLTLIAADGEPVHPVKINTIIGFSGERYDFVLTANKEIGAYWIQLRGLGECGNKRVQQLAILRYARGPYTPSTPQPTYDVGLPQGVVLNPLDAICNVIRADAICVNQLKNARRVDRDLLTQTPDVKIFLPFRFVGFSPAQLFVPKNYTTFLVPPGGFLSASVVDGVSYQAPTCPLTSQYRDNNPVIFCNGDNKPPGCGDFCACTHKIEIPLNAIVELVIIDEVGVPNLSHPFHLHGYSFNVIGMGRSEDSNVTKISLEHTLELDREGLLHRQYNQPPNKDTIAVPNNGYVVLRFRADNPGFWLIHCHFLYHLTIGMDAIVQVGTPDDLPPVPRNFPRCGNFLPPITPIRPRQYE